MTTNDSGYRQFVACDYCGTAFEQGVRYPVSVHEDTDGTLQLLSFCDETCRAAWSAEQ